MRKVLIAIQARSTSQRLPQKVHMQVGGKPILQWVIEACQNAAGYLQRDRQQLQFSVTTALLIPRGDAIKSIYGSQVEVIEGDEHDVLSRYVEAQRKTECDYLVRVTADCPRIPTYLIAKHIKSAIMRERDYTTNVHYRTFPEGFDCEVISRRLILWLDKNATTKEDREHVTSRIAQGSDFPFYDFDSKQSVCHILNDADESDQKTSIDTKEEYEELVAMFQRLRDKHNQAKKAGTVFIK